MGRTACVLLGVVLLASALRVSGKEKMTCYVCDSLGCGDPFNHKSGVDTVECETECFKKFSGEEITRGCSASESFVNEGNCVTITLTNWRAPCTCKTDFCNKGNDIISTTMTSLVFMPTFFIVLLRL